MALRLTRLGPRPLNLALVLLAGQAHAQDESSSRPTDSASASSISAAAETASQAGAGSVRCSQVRPFIPAALLKHPPATPLTVTVAVEIMPPGEVGSVTVRQSSGDKDWDDAVVAAERKLNCNLGAPVNERFVARQTLTYSKP